MGVRGLLYIWVAFMLVAAGLGAGGAGQADALDETYTAADWEEGGKLYEEDSNEYPPYLEFMEPEEEKEPSLWVEQFTCALLNLSFGVAYSIALFAERHGWVPWVFISQTLTAGMIVATVYVVVKALKPDLITD